MKKLSIILTVILAFSLIFACNNSSQSSSSKDTSKDKSSQTSTTNKAPSGKITIASVSEPADLNPMIWATSSDTLVTDMIFNSLVVPDKNLKMVGDLATNWDVSDDGKTYTFHLKKGVKWQDGKPFTAKDVAFTYKSLADPGYDAGAYWRVEPVVGADEYHAGKTKTIPGIKVIDDYTISFTTKKVFAPFISGLYIGILPEHILKDVPPANWKKDNFNRAPIGTGPFKFVKWEQGQYIELQANKEYFNGPPKVKTIIVRFGDANTMLAAFMNHEVDITSLPISEIESVKSDPNAVLKLANQLSVYYVGFNARNDNFKDVKVRQALAYALDKNSIVSSILGKYGKVANDIFPSSHWSHNPNLPKYNFDTAKADQLLTEDGYKKNSQGIYEKNGKPLKFRLFVPTGNKEREKTSVLLKQQWEAFGVKVDLQSMDFPTLVTKLLPKTKDGKQRPVTKDDFDAYILGFGVEADPDEYRSYFDSQFMPPNGYNFVGYSNPQIDKLFEAESTEVNFDKRKQDIWAIGQKLAQDEIWIPLYEQQDPYVTSKKVTGFDPDFRGVTFNAQNWGLK